MSRTRKPVNQIRDELPQALEYLGPVVGALLVIPSDDLDERVSARGLIQTLRRRLEGVATPEADAAVQQDVSTLEGWLERNQNCSGYPQLCWVLDHMRLFAEFPSSMLWVEPDPPNWTAENRDEVERVEQWLRDHGIPHSILELSDWPHHLEGHVDTVLALLTEDRSLSFWMRSVWFEVLFTFPRLVTREQQVQLFDLAMDLIEEHRPDMYFAGSLFQFCDLRIMDSARAERIRKVFQDERFGESRSYAGVLLERMAKTLSARR